MKTAPSITIPRRKIRSILNDCEKSAAAVNLTYVSDSQPGIRRLKKGEKFVYVFGNKKIQDKNLLERIRRLVIPPAWEDVWICSSANGHLQVTGLDLKKRKQYKYHQLWNSLRNQTKFYRLYDFGKAMPKIRKQLERDLSLKGLPLAKVLATVVCLMESTSIRVGSNLYEKLYGSFGLTTLKDQHVKIRGAHLQFIFKGKKGISHNISIRNKRLAAIVQKCKDIPGKELFQYINESGEARTIDSGMVNAYIKKISGEDFTAKDFRTWTGTVHALSTLKELCYPESGAALKKNIVTTLDAVAGQLGNTRTVCKKYYVHPTVLNLYENRCLHLYLEDLTLLSKCGKHDLACEEKVLMKILEKEAFRISA
jgi:DNA topoisomerase-1